MPKQALAGTYTTPIHARALTLGNRFYDRDGNEQVVSSYSQNWYRGQYVGDTINGTWYAVNESVRYVVGGSTGASLC